jgi:hypothetical protein
MRRARAPAPRLPLVNVGQLGFDRAVDVAMYVVGADAVDDSVRLEHRQNLRLHAG